MRCVYTGAHVYLPDYDMMVRADLHQCGDVVLLNMPMKDGSLVGSFGKKVYATHTVRLGTKGGRVPNTCVYAVPRDQVEGELR